MTEPFPDKPKGMHWQTYQRLFWEHHEAQIEQLTGMRKRLDSEAAVRLTGALFRMITGDSLYLSVVENPIPGQ